LRVVFLNRRFRRSQFAGLDTAGSALGFPASITGLVDSEYQRLSDWSINDTRKSRF
jgi:hypothetical protein